MNQIICISSSNWYPYPTSKQEIMKRLPGCEVLYFDPPVSWLAPLKDRTLWPRLTAWRRDEKKPQGNITVCAMPPVLPLGNRYRLINRINMAMLARYVRRKQREHGYAGAVLWMYLPGHADLCGKIKCAAKVYHCVDRHSGYKGQINPELVDAMEEELAGKCDAVFTTAQGLYDRLRPFNAHTYMAPNGANYEMFSQAQDAREVPAELADIMGPVLGFIGALQECIDYPLLRKLAEARPDCTLVFIGREHPDADVGLIRYLPNVRLLGLKPQSELPGYLARFDVCLNPFRSGNLSRDVSPLKFYEYLATGKPVVSTQEPVQVRDFADAVNIAADADGFVKAVEDALKHDTPERRDKRIAYAKACSWDARVERMAGILKERGIL